ncbi:MAG: DUF2252 family protein [Polyangiaceae bacterium]|jgi:uncharacterized protein (DUF2252 family)
MLTVDPIRLAHRQLEIDRARVARFPHLLAQKSARMTASPLGLLRGSAPLFYELLGRDPWLREGPRGKGWVVGDAHVENFGAYRAGALSKRETPRSHAKEPIVFDLNDFDDAMVAPWRLDVLRLATSVVLGARGFGFNGIRTLELCHVLIDAYVDAAFDRRRPGSAPHVVTALIDQIRTRSRKSFLDARTEVVRGQRRFIRGARFEELTRKLRAKCERAFGQYAKGLAKAARMTPESLEVIDAAFRVAGTGSLGCLRVAVLVRGRGDVDGGWIFDMKSQGEPSGANLATAADLQPAERVRTATVECLSHPPRMMGTTCIGRRSILVRRLAPQEDKLDLARLDTNDLESLIAHLGALLGHAHSRGAARRPEAPWSDGERAGLVRRAIALAGIHEALYLAYCDLAR